MALDRDELAARAVAARAALLSLCEALSALVPVAPASGAPLAAPSAAKGSDTGTAAAMPGVSPAATPAAWVPKVGDVVRVSRPPTGDEWECFMDAEWPYNHCDEGRVVETDKYHADNGKVSVARANGDRPDDLHGVEACRLVLAVRPATSSERAAAGLPVDESATKPVDRVALAKAIYASVAASNPTLNGKPWDEAKDVTKRDAFNAADAAIAFMAKGGA